MTRDQISDVIIIGGGIAGMTLAFALDQRGVKPLLINSAGDALAATPATHGISTVKGILESDQPLFGEKLAGHHGFMNWLSKVEAAAEIVRPSDVFLSGIYEDFANLDDFKREFGRIYRRDFTGAKRVRHGAAQDSFYQCDYPGDWWINPAYLFDCLETALKKRGIAVINDRIAGLKPEYDQGYWEVQGTKRNYKTKIPAICAGVGSWPLLRSLGLDGPPLFGVAGYTYVADYSRSLKPLVKGTSGAVVKSGRLHWGSTSDSAVAIKGGDEDFRLETPDSATEALHLLAKLNLSTVTSSLGKSVARWGVRCRTKSRSPVASIAKVKGMKIMINYAYYKSGLILSWTNGERLADSLVKGAEFP